MSDWQLILVYITLALALAYLVHKFIWSPSGNSKKKGVGGDCGDSDCGCH
ncbi:MAG: FeoB-associated Cys-rich membrane protein [Robiginitalea sp.]|jgi:hypothetical protein